MGSDLFFRHRQVASGWSNSETIQTNFGSFTDAALFQVDRGQGARWELVMLDGSGQLTLHRRSPAGSWTSISGVNVATAQFPDLLMSAALDGQGTVHVVSVVDDVADQPSLLYHTFNGISWSQTVLLGAFQNRTELKAFDSPHNLRDPRMLSIAVDANNQAHVTFSANQTYSPVSGGTLVRSDLFYFTGSGNSWSGPEVVLSGGGSSDAGIGASIAVGPDGTVALAASYLPRASTGSPGRARIHLLTKGQGGWSSQIISNSSNGYRSGDGERGTGLYPYLRFDDIGRPHVVFTDHASEHTGGTAWSYSGQLRYAVRAYGTTNWNLQTLVSQPTNDAFLRRLERPVLAVSPYDDRVAIFASVEERSENPYTEHFNEFFRLTGSWEALPFQNRAGGKRYHPNLGTGSFGLVHNRLLYQSESLGVHLEARDGGQISSTQLGSLITEGVSPGWIHSSWFGWTHFGEDGNTYGGWVNTERFDWMKFVKSGESTFLWVPMMNSWMAVNGDGSFTNFQWGHLTPQGLNRYQSSIFGGLTTGKFNGWVHSDRFGWMWANGDGTWFWSETRKEWLGVTPGGGIWSTAEGRFLE